MKDSVRARLRALNRAFYDEHAESFSSTRGAPWAGWLRAVPEPPVSALDVGCGNGRFLRYLLALDDGDRLARYVGTDTSLPLLSAASRLAPSGGTACFVLHDLDRGVDSLFSARFDLIVAFGVLHHIPGEDRRAAFLNAAARVLSPTGRLVVTCWQFGDDARFADRCEDWSTIGIDPRDVERGDSLLRWGDSGSPSAVRYCHFTSPGEIERLADAADLTLKRTFHADGKSGRLNLYAELGRAASRTDS